MGLQVFVKGGAIERHQMEKEVAKPAAYNQLKTMAHREEVKATEKWYKGRIDTVEAGKNAKVFRKNLERVTPEKLLPHVADRMWRRAKQLKDEFSVGMLSQDELHPVKGFMKDGSMVWVVDEGKLNSMRVVERNSAWLARNEAKIREYKNLMRHLCPENPNAGDIEKYRPKLTGVH